MSTKNRVPTAINGGPFGQAWSAKADGLQSLTGIILGAFLLVHMHFEASILLGKDAFYHVVQLLEGGMFTESGHGIPVVTQIFSVVILAIVLIHAAFALRRFPVQIGQWRALRGFMVNIKHGDTRIWFWQMVTGFLLFFLVSVHLGTMILNPEIGPHLSAERVYHDNAWLLYVLLLPIVLIHGLFGLYRVIVKWGLSSNRTLVRNIAKVLLVYLLCLGSLSLITYISIGSELTQPVAPYSPK
ncbi:MAG: fumarate reductase cytochrome b subunit [Shewanella sp.]|uniref:fumarate reductase cytochrome b subunit n=1 Tax=Shewanella sp. SNU WT4 TaxID=2590015 RepID=UPI00112B45BF|nr:fumarate reductase cytochrome b subunit [Shewanella sp. SNU WT4]QDF68212.1 fumarate reductase cytochrome b subunit [Shewanella sp. SNU WT4]